MSGVHGEGVESVSGDGWMENILYVSFVVIRRSL